MDIRVIEKEELKVIGISWNGSYAQLREISSMFPVLERRMHEIPNKSEDPVIIAPFHSRETEVTYYLTAPVKKLDSIPEGMVGFTVPRKNYIFATHRGKKEDVQNTYQQLFSWMSEYGYDQDYQALSLEIYKNEQKLAAMDDLHFDIYLPVKTYK